MNDKLIALWARLETFQATKSLSMDRLPPAARRLAFLGGLLTAHGVMLAGSVWAASSPAGTAATDEVTNVACGVINLVEGVVGKMLAFIFLAAGAVAAFVGKWAYVAGGIGGGILLIVGPNILKAAFTGPGSTCSP